MAEKVLDHFWKREIIKDKLISRVIGVLSFIILTSFGAFVRIPLPFTPVPITLQTFFVLLSGAILGKKLGAIGQAGYLILGSIGFSIFAIPLGLFGPTGGYLIGFVFAAWAVGKLVEMKKDISWIIFSMAVGSIIIYLVGTVHLSIFFGTGFKKAIYLGILPFIPGDIIKLLLASFIYFKLRGRTREIFPAPM